MRDHDENNFGSANVVDIHQFNYPGANVDIHQRAEERVGSGTRGCDKECVLESPPRDYLLDENQALVGTAVGPPPSGSGPTTTSLPINFTRPFCCIVNNFAFLLIEFAVQADQGDENYKLSLDTPYGSVASENLLGSVTETAIDASPPVFLYRAGIFGVDPFGGKAAGGTWVVNFTTTISGNITDAGAARAPRLAVYIEVCPATTTSSTTPVPTSTTSTSSLEECDLPDGFAFRTERNEDIVGTEVGPPTGGSGRRTTSIPFELMSSCCMEPNQFLFLDIFVQAEQSDPNFELSFETPSGTVLSVTLVFVRSLFGAFIYEGEVKFPSTREVAAGTFVWKFTTNVTGNITQEGRAFPPRFNFYVHNCPDLDPR
eukprot:s4507_g6.t1